MIHALATPVPEMGGHNRLTLKVHVTFIRVASFMISIASEAAVGELHLE